MDDNIKRVFALLPLFTVFFLAGTFVNGETEYLREPPGDIEVRMSKFREMAKRNAARLDGREAVVRIYDNWRENRAEFEEVYVQLEGSTIVLDFDDISETAFVVVIKESQDDEYIRRYIGDFIYAGRYKKGLKFELPHGGSFPYKLIFEDAFGIRFSGGSVKIFLYAKELGKDSRILVREVELDESGIFKAPSTNGDLNRFYVLISRPENFGYFEAGSDALGFHMRFRAETSATVRVPWVSEGTKAYESSIRGIVVDDANNPISGASIVSNVVFRPDGKKIWASVTGESYKVLTDEQGWFELYLPTKTDDYIPLKSEYSVEIEAPKELGLLPYFGRIANDTEQTIKMDNYGYFHTFIFKDKDGQISDLEKLKYVRVCVYRQEGPTLIYEYKDFKDGGYFPLGTYKAESYGDFEFKSLQVGEDSPEELVFEFRDEIVYLGKVVHGITEEPMEGAFVIAKLGYDTSWAENFSYITPEQWKRLHGLEDSFFVDKKVFERLLVGGGLDEYGFTANADERGFPEEHVALKPVRRFCAFEIGARTDSEGKFEIRLDLGATFYSFVIFEENYLGVELLRQGLSSDSENHFELPVIPLFPSAKVVVDLLPKNGNFRVVPSWVIDMNSIPEWAGKPDELVRLEGFIESDSNGHFELESEYVESSPRISSMLSYMLLDFIMTDRVWFFGIPVAKYRRYNPILMLKSVAAEIDPNVNTVLGGKHFSIDPNEDIVWLDEPFEEPKDDPNRVPSFYEIYTGSFCSFTYQKAMSPIRGCVINVPAGLDLKLEIDEKNSTDHKWFTYTSPQTTNLKQGQTLDLGVGEIKVAPQVFVKVVDSAGNPVEGIAVEHWYKKIGLVYTEKTDEDGQAAFYVRHNCYGKFIVGSEKDGQGLYEVIAYKVGGEEDADREFTITLSDKILDHLFE